VKLSVEFPSVVYREGPAKVLSLAAAIEAIGYDDLAVFDYVVVGYPTQSRPAPPYPATSPILEALVTLSFVAAVTQRVTLSTEVLVLPQRQAVLVAKQAATLDTLSGGRLRLGVGVGWQQAEYEALGEQFDNRGRTMDEAIELLRACWSEDRIDCTGQRFRADAIAMEPKPPQRDQLPIWIGGGGSAALRRAGRVGAGWMVPIMPDDDVARAAVADIRRHAEAAGRDPDTIQLQGMLAPPPTDLESKAFYQDVDRVVRRAEAVQAMGFGWLAVNATALFQAGARTVDQLTETLGILHARLRAAVG
jgi:probable F420-dependent oxidoreductase